MGKFIDLTGKRFGRLVVKNRAENRYSKEKPIVMWNCICDCGNTTVVSSSALRNGAVKSCGCYHKEVVREIGKRSLIDFSGQQIGRLKVLRRVENYISTNGSTCTKWLCQCDCGNEIVVSETRLNSGRTDYCKYGCKFYPLKEHGDLIGRKFGEWTVIGGESYKLDNNGNKRYYILCRCSCGKEKHIEISSLKAGTSQTCGHNNFYQTQRLKEINTIHGMTDTRLYEILEGIKDRCFNKKNPQYKNYGGRGITVCQEWLDDFMNFYNWAMANGYADDLTIDRIDVNGNYEPPNCRWANWDVQANNRRNNVVIEYNGKTNTVSRWAKEIGINESTFRSRLRRGWSIEKIINTNARKYGYDK